MTRMRRLARFGPAAGRAAVAAAFVLAAWGKLSGAPEAVAIFDALGAGSGMRQLTGALELTGAALLLWKCGRALGILLLGAVMVGAIAAHLGPVPGSPFVPAVLLLILVVLGRTELRRVTDHRRPTG